MTKLKFDFSTPGWVHLTQWPGSNIEVKFNANPVAKMALQSLPSSGLNGFFNFLDFSQKTFNMYWSQFLV